jgi:hypothetical protein
MAADLMSIKLPKTAISVKAKDWGSYPSVNEQKVLVGN